MSMPVNRTPTLGTSIVPLRIVADAADVRVLRLAADREIEREPARRVVQLRRSASTRARSTLSAWIRPRSESLIGVAVNNVSAIGYSRLASRMDRPPRTSVASTAARFVA